MVRGYRLVLVPLLPDDMWDKVVGKLMVDSHIMNHASLTFSVPISALSKRTEDRKPDKEWTFVGEHNSDCSVPRNCKDFDTCKGCNVIQHDLVRLAVEERDEKKPADL